MRIIILSLCLFLDYTTHIFCLLKLRSSCAFTRNDTLPPLHHNISTTANLLEGIFFTVSFQYGVMITYINFPFLLHRYVPFLEVFTPCLQTVLNAFRNFYLLIRIRIDLSKCERIHYSVKIVSFLFE